VKYMNDYDIAYARQRFTRATKPNRLALVMVIDQLAAWANLNSDGWSYWPKPLRAAQAAIALVESRTGRENRAQEAEDITDAEMHAAARPIKAFLTRQGVNAETRATILRALED
jgi:hypothetical protein